MFSPLFTHSTRSQRASSELFMCSSRFRVFLQRFTSEALWTGLILTPTGQNRAQSLLLFFLPHVLLSGNVLLRFSNFSETSAHVTNAESHMLQIERGLSIKVKNDVVSVSHAGNKVKYLMLFHLFHPGWGVQVALTKESPLLKSPSVYRLLMLQICFLASLTLTLTRVEPLCVHRHFSLTEFPSQRVLPFFTISNSHTSSLWKSLATHDEPRDYCHSQPRYYRITVRQSDSWCCADNYSAA